MSEPVRRRSGRRAELGFQGTAPRYRPDTMSHRERPMSLSVASHAAGYGKPLGSGLAGWSGVSAGADAPQRSSAAPSWSWTPPTTGSGRREARLSGLMAALSRLPAADPTAAGRSGPGNRDDAGSPSNTGPARNDAADLLQALSHDGAASAAVGLLSREEASPERDRLTVQEVAQRASTIVTRAHPVGPSTPDATEDPSVSAADAQLEALFKTLQAYGL